MTVTLRDATPDDLDGVVAVFLGCWHVTYAETLPAATIAAMTTPGARALWSRVLGESAPGEVIVAVARRADGPIAIAGVTRWAPSGWVHSLYVDPAAQGTGVGSQLLAEATRRIGRAGAATAHLWVFRDNAAGRRFYGRHGWSPDGTTRVEEEFGAPELRLTRPLDHPPRTERPADGPLVDLVTGLVDATVTTPSRGTPPAGLAVAVCAEHGAAHAVAGRRSVDTATTTTAPMTFDTLHDLASVTKVVATTTALLALVSAGQLALDDPAVRYLPEFGAGAKATITVRDLLAHRAGLWEWHPLYAVAAGDPAAADAFVDRLDLRYPPDQARHYSDLGFVQLGRIVAVVAGLPLDRAVAQLVTEPLGLVRTTFATPAGPLVAMSAFGDDVERAMLASGSPYPVPYGPDDFAGWRDRAVLGAVNDGNAFHAYGGVAGHAGLFSDLTDMIRFALALAEPEAHAASWRPDVVAEFVAPGPDAAQALGFRRYPIQLGGRSTTLVGHTGFVGCAVGIRAGPAGRGGDGEQPSGHPRPAGTDRRAVGRGAGRRGGMDHGALVMETTSPLLAIRDLSVSFRTASGWAPAVREVSLEVSRGRTLAIVGESGSGKTTTAAAINQLLPSNGRIDGGEVWFDGRNLVGADESWLRTIRGKLIGLVPQDPMSNLDPLVRVGDQIAEALEVHGLASGSAATRAAVELLDMVGIADPASRMHQYPHEFSGGMRQRVLIAIGLACRPKLLIADEPTSALDVTVQRRILDRLDALTAEMGTSVVLITHDLGLAAERADEIAVMHRGAVVERGPAASILAAPQNEYTQALLARRAEPLVASRRHRARRAERGRRRRGRPRGGA